MRKIRLSFGVAWSGGFSRGVFRWVLGEFLRGVSGLEDQMTKNDLKLFKTQLKGSKFQFSCAFYG